MHHPWWCILFVCLFFLQGCGALDAPDGRQVLSLAEPVELADTPFFPQKKFQCGPAALATLLQVSDVPVVPAELEKQVYLPKRKGSLQAELLAAVRRYDRLPYVLHDTFTALAAELAAGNPVLVLQNLGFSFSPRFHYAVVVGLTDREVILRSGEKRRLQMQHRAFLRSWQGGNYWAMVVLQPGQFPAGYNKESYLKASIALETAGRLQAAEKSYQALCTRHPDDCAEALFGQANISLKSGKQKEAIAQYRKLLALAPGHAGAANNLAEALAQLGCHAEGDAVISTFLQKNDSINPVLYELLVTTQKELRQQVSPQKQAGKMVQGITACP
jgi:tetratricopeptide (TPR) repeat protein